ncbi:hypothetical protein BU25DRAFT_486984 [Macroventuria anomochaeta]|uniref:Uncharacterized protein n=1 Tax=Macroventuria anomochaeta TaxID=301207 RepID=A0ACB6SEV5_9PLEO|nr:uncharacterized protein BU25DRAFT_486984 [Macroventuria anomochaeta]KAF2632503.1 hypothetical protein BU25DRAFT_486984 [Macroventuria anomochaeta]
MDVPGEQPTITDNKLPDQATSIRCKHCNRQFATISVEGGLILSLPQEQACASCEPFLGLYETLQTREQEHTALLDRGEKHHGRALAHGKYRNARVALENFLINIEAPNEATFDVAQAGFANRADPVQLEHTDDTAEALKPETDQQNPNGVSSTAEQVVPTEASSTVKRKPVRDYGASNLERKRIKFTETVEERPEYRGTLEFYRGAKEYVPGRYVAAEGSEYLDTSGSTLSFAKFTGQKKIGSTFIDMVPKEEAQDGEGGTSAAKKKGRGRGKRKQCETEEPHHEPEKNESQMNSRESRVSRRSRSTTPPVTTRPRRTIAQYNGQDDEPPAESSNTPSLIVVLKAPHLLKNGKVINGEEPTQAREHIDERERSSREADCDDAAKDAAKDAAEAANINKVVLNIQRELSNLQQASISSRYKDVVSTAVRGFFEVLEPLKALNHTKPHQAEEAEDIPEQDSIYFEALDVTDKLALTDIPRPAESPEQGEITPKWTHATTHNDKVQAPDIGRALDANAPDDMPEEDKHNAS